MLDLIRSLARKRSWNPLLSATFYEHGAFVAMRYHQSNHLPRRVEHSRFCTWIAVVG